MKRGPTVPPAVRRGPVGSRWGPAGARIGSLMAPYISRAPIQDSRAICRAPSGPVVPKQGSDENPPEPDMARWDPTSPDGSLDCPVLVYD